MRGRAKTTLRLSLVVILFVLVGVSCRTDPAKSKSELVQSAEKYIAADEYGKAIIEYRNALKIEPRSAELYCKVAQAYFSNGQSQEGLLAYRRALDLAPDYIPAQLALGQIALAAEQYDEAMKYARAVLEKNPDQSDARMLLAAAYAGKKNLPEAARILEKLVKEKPAQVHAHINLGIVYASQSRPEAAREQLEVALVADPKSIDARKTLADFYVNQGRLGQGEEQYLAAVKGNPDSVQARQVLADFYLRQRRFSDAEPVYKDLVKLQKNSAASQFVLANFYLQTGKAGEARKLDEDIARTEPSFLPARLQLAEMALSEQKYDDADRIVGGILKERPKEPQALILQARLSLARNNPRKAVQDLENAQRLEPSVPALHYWKGVAYRLQANFDLAEHSFEQALSLNEHYVDAQIALAQLAIDRGRSEEGLRYVQQALRENPRLAAAHYMAGNAYFNLKDLPKAEAEFQAFVQLQPSSPTGLARLGYVHLMQHRYDDAEKEFEKSLALDPKQIDALNGLVAVYRLRGQNDKAIARVRQEIAKHETAVLDDLLGKTYAELGQSAAAERSLKRALELDPQSFATYALLASLYAEQKTTDKAIAELQQAVRVNPKSVGAWTLLGMLHYGASQPKLAASDYEAALAIEPSAGLAANNLAWIYCQQGGDMDKALELARRAKQALPNVATVSDTLAWIYYKRQLFDSAIPLLREAVREQPKDAQIHFHLAASLLGAGKKAQAREELNAALNLDASLRKDEDYKRIFDNM